MPYKRAHESTLRHSEEPRSRSYTAKPDGYFGRPRVEIQALLPARCDRVLEIGCGTGATLDWLRRQGRCAETYGVELFGHAAAKAEETVDHVFQGDIEVTDSPFGDVKFDLILALDVLEHLTDPWVVLNHVVEKHLSAHGTVIVSLPNVRCYSVLIPLLFRGRWDYEDSGILDRTHLRFFSRVSAIALLESSGLHVDAILRNPCDFRSRTQVLDKLSLRMFSDFLTQQYILRAVATR